MYSCPVVLQLQSSAVVSVDHHLRLQHVAPTCPPGPVPGFGGGHHLAGGAEPLVGDRPHHLSGRAMCRAGAEGQLLYTG